MQSTTKIAMADGGPPAPQSPPVIPPVVPPASSMQLLVLLTQPIVPSTQPVQAALMLQLNWSHFKPEFIGRPDEDAKAHLRTNDWIDNHALLEGVKVQRFCLTLVGEARSWYESLRPIASLCHDAMRLHMCYIINCYLHVHVMMGPPHDIIGRTL